MITTWQKVKLGDVVDITSSKRIFMSEYKESGVPFYRGKEIIEKYKGADDISTPLFISEKKYLEIKNKFGIPKENDILLTSVGTLGYPYLVKKNDKFYFKDGNLTWFRKFSNTVDQKYIFYWIRSPIGKNTILSSSIGSSQAALTIDGLKKLEILLPSDNEQKRIASILSAFDDKIELNNKISKNLEQTAQTIFKEWFVGREKLKIKGEKLSKLGKIICGKTPSKSNLKYFGGKIPFIKIPDMHNQMFILKAEDSLTEAGANSQKNKFIPKNSICISCIATVGLVSITTEDSQTNQQINTIIPKSENYLEFLYFALKTIKNDLISIGSGGSTTLNINTSVFSSIEILVSEEEMIDKFHKLANPMFNKILKINIENQKLAVLRDLLLPKLMSGEIKT